MVNSYSNMLVLLFYRIYCGCNFGIIRLLTSDACVHRNVKNSSAHKNIITNNILFLSSSLSIKFLRSITQMNQFLFLLTQYSSFYSWLWTGSINFTSLREKGRELASMLENSGNWNSRL